MRSPLGAAAPPFAFGVWPVDKLAPTHDNTNATSIAPNRRAVVFSFILILPSTLASRNSVSGKQAAHECRFCDASHGQNHRASSRRNVMLAHRFHHLIERAHHDFLPPLIHFVRIPQ